MDLWMSGVGYLFALVYLAIVLAAVTVALLSLWRAMRAHERMAETLTRIERSLARDVPRSDEPPA